jgi:amino acid transporter
VILYPDGISGPPTKKKGKGGKAQKIKKAGAGKVLVGTSKALVPTSSSSTALATTSGGPATMWPWILGGLLVLAGAFWYTRKGKGRRRPLGFA